MVATGVADRARERIAQLVYLDAFVPHDGQSLFDLQPPDARARMRELARTDGDGWRLPPTQMPADTPDADVAWASGRRRPQPIRTFEQPLRLAGNAAQPPRSYIYCQRSAPADVFRQFAERAQRENGWRYFEIDASHNPHITAPQALLDLLAKIASTAA
jgi:hypothetical protein